MPRSEEVEQSTLLWLSSGSSSSSMEIRLSVLRNKGQLPNGVGQECLPTQKFVGVVREAVGDCLA